MMRFIRPLTRLVCFGSCLAAVTACGKRVEGAARENDPARPVAVTTTTAPTLPTLPARSDTSARPDSPEIIHVTATELIGLVRRSNLRGTLVNVWATWCGPCRDELPMLAKIHRAYKQRGIAVLPLSVDEPEQESKIAPMLEEYGFKGPYYVATRPLDELKATLSAEWPGNIPVSFLLDGRGNGKYFFTAQVYENELIPKLDLYLRGALEVGKSNFGVAPGKTF